MDALIRTIRPDEYVAARDIVNAAFGAGPNAESAERQRPFWELDRMFAAEDSGTLVSGSANLSMSITVPGGASLPLAGVTAVGVAPTHRRLGILTAMMRRILEDARDHEEPLAGLYASESLIYGRFGYGSAIEHAVWSIDRDHTTFAFASPARGAVRLVTHTELRPHAEAVWPRVAAQQPGMTARTEKWWNRRFDAARENAPQFCVVYLEDGRCDGYAMYSIAGDWQATTGLHASVVSVRECIAATDAAYAALWGYLLSLDLVKTIEAGARPVDEPLMHMLEDPRQLQRRVRDGVWLRVLDIPRALEARSYSAEGRIVLDVVDTFCPWAGGRFALDATPQGATVRVTTESPDLVLPTASLAAAYMGGTRFSALARANRVEERTSGALRLADALFATDRAPWSPEHW